MQMKLQTQSPPVFRSPFNFTTHLETTAPPPLPTAPPLPPYITLPLSPLPLRTFNLSFSRKYYLIIFSAMRMSCNGCRVLRKGCSQNCIIRPCLQWLKSPDSQANATLFLAKFYGRAGLLNLIEAGPENLRPAIFRSLLYEACGRVVNPVYGSVGMLWSGNWVDCQAAVDAVLKGSQITQTSSSPPPPPPESLSQPLISPLKTYDIRHVFKDPNSADADKVKTRARYKRSASSKSKRVRSSDSSSNDDSWMNQQQNGDSKEDEISMFSVETVEGSLVNRTKKAPAFKFANQAEESGDDMGLELTLGLAPSTMQLRG